LANSENKSWRPYSKPLVILAFAAVVIGPDGLNPVLLLVNPAALVGKADNVGQLLSDVGGDGDGGGVSLLGSGPEDGVSPLLGPGGGLEVGVIILLQDIDGELQQIPVLGFLQDTVVGVVPADGTCPGDVRFFAVFTAQNDRKRRAQNNRRRRARITNCFADTP